MCLLLNTHLSCIHFWGKVGGDPAEMVRKAGDATAQCDGRAKGNFPSSIHQQLLCHVALHDGWFSGLAATLIGRGHGLSLGSWVPNCHRVPLLVTFVDVKSRFRLSVTVGCGGLFSTVDKVANCLEISGFGAERFHHIVSKGCAY